MLSRYIPNWVLDTGSDIGINRDKLGIFFQPVRESGHCNGCGRDYAFGHGFDSHHLHQKLGLRGKTLNLLHCKKSPVFKAQRLFC